MSRVLIAMMKNHASTVARAVAMDGHVTVTAEDGAEPLEILTREQARSTFCWTDIQMPVMDGIAAGTAVARDFPDLEDSLDDGFCRSARTRLRAQCHRA